MSEEISLTLIEDPVANSSEVVPRLPWEKIDYKPLKLQDFASLYC